MESTLKYFMLKPKNMKILKSARDKEITKKKKKSHKNCRFYKGNIGSQITGE